MADYLKDPLYERDYDFSAYQANNPSKPLPGDSLDNELANVSKATEALRNMFTDSIGEAAAEFAAAYFEAEKDTAVGEIGAAGDSELAQIAAAGDAELVDIAAAGDAELVDIAAAGDAELAALATARATEVTAIQAAGDAELADIAAAGASVVANADIYPDTATALGVLSVNDQFGVVSGDEIIRYRVDSGPVATELTRYPTSASVTTLETETANYRAAGDPVKADTDNAYDFSVRDSAGNIAIGLRKDGTVDMQPGVGFVWPNRPDRYGARLRGQIACLAFMGQSNEVGYGASPKTTTPEYDNLSFTIMESSPVNWKEAFASTSERPDFAAMGHIKALLGTEDGIALADQDYRLVAMSTGVSNQTIEELSKSGSSGAFEKSIEMLTTSKSLADARGKSCIAGAMFWTQGEASSATAIAAYIAAMKTLVDDYNTDAKAVTSQTQDIPLITWQVNSVVTKNPAVAQWRAAMEHPLIYLACPSYQLSYTLDFQHIDGDGIELLGSYYGLAYKRVVIDGQDWEPLQPQSVSVLGDDIIIQFNRTNIEFDTSLVPAQTDYGFTVVNAALSAQTISSVEILPGGRVRLSMATTPVSGWFVRYGMITATGMSPYVGGAGNLRDNAGDVLTYKSNPLHNWCVLFDWEL